MSPAAGSRDRPPESSRSRLAVESATAMDAARSAGRCDAAAATATIEAIPVDRELSELRSGPLEWTARVGNNRLSILDKTCPASSEKAQRLSKKR